MRKTCKKKRHLLMTVCIAILCSFMIQAEPSTIHAAQQNNEFTENGIKYSKCEDGSIQDITQDLKYEYNKKKKSYILNETGEDCGKEVYEKIIIPDTIKGKKVTEIASDAFEGKTEITSIELGKNVTLIGEYAFEGCKNLQTITIKGKIKKIPRGCFYECNSLKKIKIPETVTTIEELAFYECDTIKTIVIPKKVKNIESYAFTNCDNLKKATIKSDLKAFNYVFNNCKSLQKVNFTGKVDYIASFSFESCKSLYQIKVSKNVKKIDTFALQDRNNITIIAPKHSPVYKQLYENKEIPVTDTEKFKFNINSSLMLVGETKQIRALNYPNKLKWKSSNKNILKVTKDGKVTAVKAGKATLTATDKTKKFKFNIEVLPRTLENTMKVITTEYVRPELTDYEKVVEANAWLVKNVKYDFGNYMLGTIPYVSYKAEGALVNGLAVCNGYSLAFQKIMDYYGIPCQMVVSWEMNHGWNAVKIGEHWYHVDTTWNDPIINGSSENTTVYPNYLLLSNDEIGDHYGYDFTCNTPNKKVDKNYRTKTAASETVIKDKALAPYLNTIKVTLTKGGKDFQLKIVGTKAKSFKSKNKKIATVNKKGVIKAKKRGTTTIEVKGADRKKYTCKVKVETPTISKTKYTINKGETHKLKITGNSKKVTWKTSNSKIATVTNKGKIKGIAKGNAVITATIDGKKLTCNLEVHEHTYTKKVTEPTCKQEGKEEYTCSCGKKYSKNLPIVDHKYDWIITKEASKTKASGENDFGIREFKCIYCNDLKERETIINIGDACINGYFETENEKELCTAINELRKNETYRVDESGNEIEITLEDLKRSTQLDFEAKLYAAMYAYTNNEEAIKNYPGVVVITYHSDYDLIEDAANDIWYQDYAQDKNLLRENISSVGISCFHYNEGKDENAKLIWVVLLK